jgi:hypothetical protein
VPRPEEQRARPGRFRRWLDRTVLGLLMGVAIWFVERRLRKVLGGASADDEPARRVVDVG